MKLFARSILVGSLALVPALAAGSAFADGPTGAAPEPGTEAGSHGHHGGMARVLAETLAQLDLTPEQRSAIDALRDLVVDRRDVREARRALVVALADGLASGKIDRPSFRPYVHAFTRAEGAADYLRVRAMQEIHRVLTPAQRAKFVSLIEQRMERAAAEHAPGAHLDKVAKELGLSDDQKAQLREIFDRHLESRAKHRELFRRVLAAFQGESFDVRTVVPEYDPFDHARTVARSLVELADAATYILTPEQRNLAARKLREKIARADEEGAKTGGKSGATGSEATGSTQSPLIWGFPSTYGYTMPYTFGTWAWPGYTTMWGWPLGTSYFLM